MDHLQKIEVLKALADDARLSIVSLLAKVKEPVSSCDIVTKCTSLSKLSQPTVSHHFSRLVKAGIVDEQKYGTEKVYTLAHEKLESIGLDVTKI